MQSTEIVRRLARSEKRGEGKTRVTARGEVHKGKGGGIGDMRESTAEKQGQKKKQRKGGRGEQRGRARRNISGMEQGGKETEGLDSVQENTQQSKGAKSCETCGEHDDGGRR